MEVVYNGYRFVKDKKTGYYLSAKKIDGKRERLHRYVYRCEVGDILPGYDVHHVDGDKDNNGPENLRAVLRSKHKAIHAEILKHDESKLAFAAGNVPCSMKTKKIKSIKPAGKADVYNITTKNHHNFIVVGGFVLHNCDALRYFVSTVVKARRIANA